MDNIYTWTYGNIHSWRNFGVNMTLVLNEVDRGRCAIKPKKLKHQPIQHAVSNFIITILIIFLRH